MKSLCIISCGKKKIWDKNPEAESVKAENLYTGSFTRKCVEYAGKGNFDSWSILSAKYGFLFPEDIVQGPYNECFHIISSNPISLTELSLQLKVKGLNKYEKIIILGGNYYTNMINKLFTNKIVYNPLNGCKGIGDMMKKINNLIDDSSL